MRVKEQCFHCNRTLKRMDEKDKVVFLSCTSCFISYLFEDGELVRLR